MINDKTYTNLLLRIIQFLLRKNGYKVEYGHFSDINPYSPNVTFLYPLISTGTCAYQQLRHVSSAGELFECV